MVVTLALNVLCAHKARGSGGRALPGKFWIIRPSTSVSGAFFEGESEVSGCLDGEFYLSIIQTQ